MKGRNMDTYKTKYFMLDDEPVIVYSKDGLVTTETKNGQPKSFVRTLEDGIPITKDEFDRA
jgi:hypothetical protein